MKYFLVFLLSSLWLSVSAQEFPFPYHATYADHIKPSQYAQTELDDQVRSFYNQWKETYLSDECETEELFIRYRVDANTVSEAHGYGMMVFAYMAGHDEHAQEIFDGMYRYYRSHPSRVNQYLMDWQQVTCMDPISSADGSATDGDIDIAFSLLIAHAQWGSAGDINYLEAAENIIEAIMRYEINQETWTVKLGDWSTSTNPFYYYSTRTSDFITSHFKAFACAFGDNRWRKVSNKCYELITHIQSNYSENTGLLPDFIVDVNGTAKPAEEGFLEGEFDGSYYYNACRDPWRLGTDYLINGNQRAKTALNKINEWIRSATGGQPNQISNGYKLDGTKIYSWNDATYVAPLAVSAMIDPGNQQWLNVLYQSILDNDHIDRGDYYSHTIKMLCLLVISGNYWTPNCEHVLGLQPREKPLLFPNPAHDKININWTENRNSYACSLSIKTLDGKTVKSIQTSCQQDSVDVDKLPKGLYIIELKSGNKIEFNGRFVKV